MTFNLEGIPQSNDLNHEITWSLQTPFNWCNKKISISLIETSLALQNPSYIPKVWTVATRIFTVIALIPFLLLATLPYGAGAIYATVVKTPSIDMSMLHVTPPETGPPKTNLTHNLDKLETWINQEDAIPYKNKFIAMLDKIKSKDRGLLAQHNSLPNSFYDDMTLYLKNIIDYLIQEEAQKRRNVLIDLAKAANACPPTWYEEAKKQLNLFVCPNGAEIQLLYWIQEIKEETILHFMQNTLDVEWHGLNQARYWIGEELGLDQTGLKNDQWIDKAPLSNFHKLLFIKSIKSLFLTTRFISAIQMKVNETYRPCFYEMLETAIRDRGCNDVNTFIAEHFYEDDYTTMNRNGIIMLLKIIGFLK
ncbi:MAG: hypothetical protein S4CHLAM45_02860 [Chlamydiales bacterium]|nr:hypothetical protein [Chlamydiales bacterium]MCH9619144.1 hypothetical protein [Chlamydiales bacterium]MCH9622406.1 hypothetical protein [Chlamydiales bacterium]